jgi:hypothetical protein
VVCLECGKMVARLVQSRCHARHEHGLDRAAYLAKWPGAALASVEAAAADLKARQTYKKDHRPQINQQRRVRFAEIKAAAAADPNGPEAAFLESERKRSSETWERKYWGEGPEDEEAAAFRQSEAQRRSARHGPEENEAQRDRYWANIDVERARNAAKQRERTARLAKAERRVIELREELQKQEAIVEQIKAKLGRPRTLAEDVVKYGPRLNELRTPGPGRKSWGQVMITMNNETGEKLTVSGWRHIARASAPENRV